MEYSQLKDGERVNVFVPAINRFVRMEVTKRIGDDKGGFSVSNFDTNDTIEGHDFMAIIRTQLDLNKFFFIHPGKVTKKNRENLIGVAKQHFSINGKSWIFD